MQYCLKTIKAKSSLVCVYLKKPEYGTGKFDDNGEELINWEGFRTEYADQHGFDIREINENGEYWEDIFSATRYSNHSLWSRKRKIYRAFGSIIR